MTPSGMAAAIGLAPSTFTRFMKEPDGSEKTLSARTMDKVEELRQVNSDAPVFTQAQSQWQTIREEAEPFKMSDEDTVLGRALRELMNNRPGVDPWTLRSRALELEGFMPGDIVLVDLNATPAPGDAVCAQVYDRGGVRAETVMRQFRNTGAVSLLMPRSLDPTLQQPLVVDNDRVLIRGVLLPYRFKAPLAA